MDYKTREPSEGLRRRNFDHKSNVDNLLTDGIRQTIQFIHIEKLIPFENQRRSHFDSSKLEALSETIKAHGVRQPLTVIESDKQPQHFEIVSGERRYRAAVMANLEKIPCIIIHNRKEAEEIALIENVQREDLHPIELGRGYKQMMEAGLATSQTELSKKLGVPRTQISEYIPYADIPVATATLIIEKGITQRSVLRKVIKCKTKEEMLDVINHKKNNQNTSTKRKVLEIYWENGVLKYQPYDMSGINDEYMNEILEIMRDEKGVISLS